MVRFAVDTDLAFFSQRLRAVREKLDMSQHELARLCGLSINQISRYELGLREPTSTSLVKIARALNVSIDYLAGLADAPNGQLAAQELSPHEREILETFKREGWSGLARLSVERLSK
jgi:transcriptional regulator with XRE-family HTH domain